MPRKQNGFGSPQSFAFKGGGRVDKGKGAGAPGSYPSSRRYGTSVTRTVIEKYDLDSNWTKWRQGYEIWSKAYYSLLRVENPNYNDSQPEEGINIPYVQQHCYQCCIKVQTIQQTLRSMVTNIRR